MIIMDGDQSAVDVIVQPGQPLSLDIKSMFQGSSDPQRTTYDETNKIKPEINQEFFDKIGGNRIDYPLGHVFTDREVSLAAGDTRAVVQLIEDKVALDPSILFQNFDEVIALISPKAVRDATLSCLQDIDYMMRYNMVLEHFSHLKPFFSDEEWLDILIKIQSIERYSSAAHFFSSPEIINLLGADRTKTLVIDSIKKCEYFDSASVGRVDFAKYVSLGVFTWEEVANIAIQSIENSGQAILLLFGIAEEFNDQQREHLRTLLYDYYLSTSQRPYLGDLAQLTNILTSEQIDEILRKVLREKPKDIQFCLGLASQRLTPEEFSSWLDSALVSAENGDSSYSYLFYPEEVPLVVSSELVSLAQKKKYSSLLCDRFPEEALQAMEWISQVEPALDLASLVRGMVFRVGISDALTYWKSWLPFVSKNPLEQSSYLLGLAGSTGEFEFSYAILHDSEFCVQFEPSVLEKLKAVELRNGAAVAMDWLFTLRKLLGSDEAVKQYLQATVDVNPNDFFKSIHKVSFLYSREEMEEILSKTTLTEKGFMAVLSNRLWEDVPEWGFGQNRVFLRNLLYERRFIHPAYLLHNWSWVAEYFPPEEREKVHLELAALNPMGACLTFEFGGRGSNPYSIDTTQLLNRYITDSAASGFPDAYLRKLAAEAEVYEAGAMSRLYILEEGAVLTSGLQRISNCGLEHDLVRISSQEGLSRTDQRELLEIFVSFADIQTRTGSEIQAEIGTVQSLADARNLLMLSLSHLLDLNTDISEEEALNFTKVFHTPSAFCQYVLQYYTSPIHSAELRSIFTSVSQGEFQSWKYSGSNGDGLAELQTLSLLPTQLDNPQFTTWMTDESTSLWETLEADAGQTAQAVRKMVIENSVDALPGVDKNFFSNQNSYLTLTAELQSIGQEIGLVSKTISEMQRTKNGTGMENSELSRARAHLRELMEKKQQVSLMRNLAKLAQLKPVEISSGKLFSPNGSLTASITIQTICAELSNLLPTELHFIPKNVLQLYSDFLNQSSEHQNFVATDTANPKVTLEIGAKPIGSCQHYAHGSYNECLLGYFDPNTKILILTNEKGSIVARSVFRLLQKKDGSPALHVERIYSVSASQAVESVLLTHALNKANSLGVSLYVSKSSQDDEGIETDTLLPQGFKMGNQKCTLNSLASRSPFVYVDSAGGKNKRGNYSITDAVEVISA